MSLDLRKVKSYHIIDIKYKTKYKKFITTSNNFATFTNFVTFKGAEINADFDLTNLENIKEFLKNTEVVERYYPWISIIEIQIKRYKEE